LDLCAFTGAAWFLVSNVAIKPIVRACNKDQSIVDAEKKEYLHEKREYQTIYFNSNN
jgi:hypothetical protein